MEKEMKDEQLPRISEEMIATIVSVATTGVNGVARISIRTTDEIMDKLNLTSSVSGVKIARNEEGLLIWVFIITEKKTDIIKVSKEVQYKVKTEVEALTKLPVVAVNVRIEGIDV